jgi:hypothetical protein
VYTDDSTDRYPGWPFVLPDNRALIFARGVNTAFSGGGAGLFPGVPITGPQSDVYIVDIETGTVTILAQAMGMKSVMDPTSATPFGDADLHQPYYPTVSPVAAGGYFWVFFDSIRTYGNLGSVRQLWGSAITIAPDGKYLDDPSHPAFFVTGQAAGSGNHRAFAALDPCKADGQPVRPASIAAAGFAPTASADPRKIAARRPTKPA